MLPLLAHAGKPDESIVVAIVVAALWIAWIGWSRIRGKAFARLPRIAAFVLLGVAGVLVVTSVFVPRVLFKTSTVATGPRPASTASVSFRQPADGEVVTGNELNVVLDLTGGTVVDAGSTTVTPDTGHIHLSLDGRLVSMTYGTTQVLDLYGVAPGEHTLQAEFVAADHAPFDPRVSATITFTKAGS